MENSNNTEDEVGHTLNEIKEAYSFFDSLIKQLFYIENPDNLKT